jgi:hypothetical protein
VKFPIVQFFNVATTLDTGEGHAQPDFQPGQHIVVGVDKPGACCAVVESGSWGEAHLEPGDSILAIGTEGRFRYLETDFETSAEVRTALAQNPVELKVRKMLAEHGRIWRTSPKRDATSTDTHTSPTSPGDSPGGSSAGNAPPGILGSEVGSLKE